MGIFRRTRTNGSSISTSSSTAPSGSTTPTSTSPTTTTAPSITLTKTTSRLTLSKTLTWGKRREEDKQRRRIEDWEREDANEWAAPTARRGKTGKGYSKKHQEVLRAFEWKGCRDSLDGGRSRSMFSGISPGCSRVGSVDDGDVGLHSTARQRSMGLEGPLSREMSRSDEHVDSVRE